MADNPDIAGGTILMDRSGSVEIQKCVPRQVGVVISHIVRAMENKREW